MAYLDFTLKNLPEAERPRERLLIKGASALSLSELLAIVIGKGAPGEPVTFLTQKIVSRCGDVSDIKKFSIQDLIAIKGIGVAKACQLTACFEIARRLSGAPVIKSKEYNTADEIYRLVKPYLVNREKEHFIVVTLDTRRRLIAVDNISIGSLNQSIVHPREVFKAAINRRASSIVLAHNHPSGDTSPTSDDLAVTERLVNVSHTIGIPVLDHIIVSDHGYTSLYREEYIGEYVQ